MKTDPNKRRRWWYFSHSFEFACVSFFVCFSSFKYIVAIPYENGRLMRKNPIARQSIMIKAFISPATLVVHIASINSITLGVATASLYRLSQWLTDLQTLAGPTIPIKFGIALRKIHFFNQNSIRNRFYYTNLNEFLGCWSFTWTLDTHSDSEIFTKLLSLVNVAIFFCKSVKASIFSEGHYVSIYFQVSTWWQADVIGCLVRIVLWCATAKPCI